MTETEVVSIATSDYDVYIGRPSKWGNPFVIGTHGTRSEVIRMYAEYVRGNSELMAAIGELRGKRLGCHCSPKACHGDVLVEILEQLDREDAVEY